MEPAFEWTRNEDRIAVWAYRCGERGQRVAWAIRLDGEDIGTAATEEEALDFARATMALWDSEAVESRPPLPRVWGRP